VLIAVRPLSNITMRAAHPSEARAIASMSRLHIEYGLDWRWTPAKVRRQIKDPDTMVLIASREGAMAGFAIMKFGQDQAHLFLLAVRPDCRRAGIGRSMMAWLEKSCRTAGIQSVRLEVRASNRTALRFYRQLGYRYVARVAGYYDRREAAIIMARLLNRQNG
jgi:ribosomal-protein-alanine N-acetyltransferase